MKDVLSEAIMPAIH